MNPITFNEPFEDLCRTRHFDTELKEILGAAMKSPLVLWENSSDPFTQAAFDAASEENGLPKLPFSSFRADVTFNQEDGSKIRTRMVIWSDGGIVMCFTRIIGCASPQSGTRIAMKGLMEKDLIIMAAFSENGGRHIRTFWKKTGRAASDAPQKIQGVIHALTVGMLAHLAVDFSNPHFHLCRKNTPEDGVPRSVEWKKAREHYVLLHKSHAANKKDAVGKHVIEGGGTLERSAHSRRAHYRMLRSPRFRHKVGQRVWVASAWVGPKEWTDRSGQIYKIVDRHLDGPK